MPLTARLENQVTGFGDHLDAVEDRADTALEDEAVLIFVPVSVHRCGDRARGQEMFDDGESSVCLRGVEEEPVADTIDRTEKLALRGADEA
ncbi:hypothetical protein GORHZ_154_00300 [Gordonia rhizosphera NBRC 16068]|uniref:Uncharacterized protein n=1 Tax=Gordonia rhizosphera NBRC 16068 TaxID=1108045 RepID=K6WDX6_9ACTN|nr:hypothetical protein GORHZ_154_00300 [Gordonia rhizosphera NBRC 16068]